MMKIKKAQGGQVLLKSQKSKTNKYGITRTKATSLGDNYKYKSKTVPTEDGSMSVVSKRRTLKGLLKGADRPSFKRSYVKQDKEGNVTSAQTYRSGGKMTKAKGGKQMMKRADGSVSQRGLWDNIRAAAKRNKAAGKPGKKPTAAMLKQERKIKAKGK